MDAPRGDPKKRRIRAEWILARFDHASAWVSAVVLILYIVSGYGMTRADKNQSLTGGLMTPARALALHNGLFIPLVLTFALHTFMGMRRALVRATKKKQAAGWIAAGAGALLLAYLLVLGV